MSAYKIKAAQDSIMGMVKEMDIKSPEIILAFAQTAHVVRHLEKRIETLEKQCSTR